MPLYEYVCKSCGERFEVRQKFSDEPVTKHEECGGDAERLLSAPAFQFKGTGWYVTDGKGESKSESKSESSPAPKTETKSETKSTAESKPA
jgi:putative FmdB family regulatory protein